MKFINLTREAHSYPNTSAGTTLEPILAIHIVFLVVQLIVADWVC